MSVVAANRGQSASRKMLGSRHGSVARFSPPRRDLPDPMDLVLWRQAAEAELERALTELDERLLRGGEIHEVQISIAAGYMKWTRRSIARFTSESRSADLGEVHRWQSEADRATAVAEPERLERFLRIWLAVIHEAAASGRASLYALR